MRIAEHEWAQLEQITQETQHNGIIPHQLIIIRKKSSLRQLFRKYPDTGQWIMKPYDMREIQYAILHLKTIRRQVRMKYRGDILNRP